MNLKKAPIFKIFILPIILVSSITGCNNTNNASSNFINDTNIQDLENINIEELKKEKISITVWNTLGGTSYDLMADYIKKFEIIYPNFSINQVTQGNDSDLDYNLTAAIPAKTTPTMAIIDHLYIADYISYNAIENMSPYFEVNSLNNDEDNDFLSNLLESGTSFSLTNDIYSLPFLNYSNVLYYNESILTDSMISSLNKQLTWEDDENSLISIAKKIKENNDEVIPLYIDSYDSLYILLSHQYNVPYVSLVDTAKGHIDFANNAAIDLVKKVKEWVDKELVSIGDSAKGIDSKNPFDSNVAMAIAPTNKYLNYSSNNKVRATLIPQQNKNYLFNEILGQDAIIFKVSPIKEKIVAWLFYKFITNSENSLELSLNKGCIPLKNSSYNLDFYKNKIENNNNHLEQDILTLYQNLVLSMKQLPSFVGSLTAKEQVGLLLKVVCIKDFSTLSNEEINDYLYNQFENAYTVSVIALGNK